MAPSHPKAGADSTQRRVDTGPIHGFVETTFIGMGALAALVIADDFLGIDSNVGDFSKIAKRIGALGGAFDWPLPRAMNDHEAYSAAHLLEIMVTNFR